MKLTKEKVLIFNVIRTTYILTYVLFAVLYVAAYLEQLVLPSAFMVFLYYLSQFLMLVDFIAVAVMLLLAYRCNKSAGSSLLLGLSVILVVNLLYKLLMLFVWYSGWFGEVFELDLLYYVLEGCFIVSEIVILTQYQKSGNNA